MLIKVIKSNKSYKLILPNNIEMRIDTVQDLQRCLDLELDISLQLWEKINTNLNPKHLD
jgi:hypothetical protein